MSVQNYERNPSRVLYENVEPGFLKDLTHFDYTVVRGKDSTHPFYNKVFALWYGVWKNVYTEQVGLKKYYSEDFFMCDEIHTILYKNNPVACVSSTYFDIRQSSYRTTKFLKNQITTKVLEYTELYELYKVNVMSNLVTSEILKTELKIPRMMMAYIIMSVGLKSFVNSPAQLMITCARNDLNVNDMVSRLGGIFLEQTITNSRKSDILLIRKQDFTTKNLNPSMNQLINFLWNKSENKANMNSAMNNIINQTYHKGEKNGDL